MNAEVRRAALRLLADLGPSLVLKAWNEAKVHRDHGKFASTGGGTATAEGDSAPPTSPRPAGWLKRHTLDKLPPKAQKVAKAIGTAYFASYVAANKSVQAVAKARGLSGEQAGKLAKVLTGVDMALGGSRTMAACAALGVPALGLPASFVPWASVGYLAYSTARNPIAVARAAKEAIKGAAAKLAGARPVLKSAGASGSGADDTTYHFADAVAEAMAAHGFDDYYHALLVEAVKHTGDVAAGIELANAAWDEHSADRVLKALAGAAQPSAAPAAGKQGRAVRKEGETWQVGPNHYTKKNGKIVKTGDPNKKREPTKKDQRAQKVARVAYDRAKTKTAADKLAAGGADLTHEDVAHLDSHFALLTQKQMQRVARAIGQKVGGKKAELAVRLVEHARQLAKGDGAPGAQPPTDGATHGPGEREAGLPAGIAPDVLSKLNTTETDERGEFHDDGLPHYVTDRALPDESRAYLTKITPEEANAVREYAGSMNHAAINDSLRAGADPSRADGHPARLAADGREQVAALDRVFAAAPVLAEPVTVHSGLDMPASWVADMEQRAAAGGEWADPGFRSASTDTGVARSYGAVTLKIDARHGIDATPLTGEASEKEFLLPRGSRFKVLSVDRSGPKPVVHLQQVADPPAVTKALALDPAALALALATLRAEGTDEADHAAAELLHLAGIESDADGDGVPDSQQSGAPPVAKACAPAGMNTLAGSAGGFLVTGDDRRRRRKRKRRAARVEALADQLLAKGSAQVPGGGAPTTNG